MIYGLIIAAGNQSRFKMETPKALVSIGGSSLLDDNIRKMSIVCDVVKVVCSTTNAHHFSGYDTIVIDSGFGCGDAVYKALMALGDVTSADTCFIQWGDSLVDEGMYSETIDNYSGELVIPCKTETDPYVGIVNIGDGVVQVMFSKYGEKLSSGLHDMSLFYGNIDKLMRHTQEFVHKFFDGTSYIHRHGNEFQFLDLLNDTGLCACTYETEFDGFSFNTVEEMINFGKR